MAGIGQQVTGEGPVGVAGPSVVRPWGQGRARAAAAVYGQAVVQALPAWVASRLLVVAGLVLSHLIVSTVRPDNAGAQLRVHQGLLAWDGGWYQSIAGHGYAASGLQSVRFFPGYPMAARVLGWIPGVGVGTALVVISNACALAAMAALVVLVRHDLGDGALARRSVWLLALAPSAYSLVLGYADSALLLCSIVTVLAARTQRWWWAAAAGGVDAGDCPATDRALTMARAKRARETDRRTTTGVWRRDMKFSSGGRGVAPVPRWSGQRRCTPMPPPA